MVKGRLSPIPSPTYPSRLTGRRFIRLVLEDVDMPLAERGKLREEGELDEYLNAHIEDHRAHPRDDLTSFLLEAELDGNKLGHIRGTMVPLIIAGIDTTWSAIGASLWHPAQHPGDRRRLPTTSSPTA